MDRFVEKDFVSIVMPVFNTGRYLSEAVESVLRQESLTDCAVPAHELLIVDDRSTDGETRAILRELAGSHPRIRILENERGKGVSGARNTGILHARGEWIGFLDSDDLYLPHALASHRSFIRQQPSAEWVAGHFVHLRPDTGIDRTPLATRSPNLYALIGHDYEAHRPSCLHRPLEAFAKNCLFPPPAVLIKHELIIEKGMFNEKLPRAEDYYLWLKCAVDTDLWIIPTDVFVHRMRKGSLTLDNEPMFYQEHQLIDLLLDDPAFQGHKPPLLKRLDVVMNDYCYFYRGNLAHDTALHWAMAWTRKRPFVSAAWKQLIASALRR